MLYNDASAAWLAMLATVPVAALCEEALFRGCVTTHLTDALRPGAACALSVLLFALPHGSVTGLPGHLLISLLCTLLMMSTGRVLGPILAHLGYNAMALWGTGLTGSPWLLAAGLLPLGLMGRMLIRMNWQPRPEQAPAGIA